MSREDVLKHAADLGNLGLTLTDPEHELETVLPRPDLLDRLEHALSGAHLNPVLVGDRGVGKSALVTEFATRLRAELLELPGSLRWKARKIVRIGVTDLISGAIFANDLEHKIKLVVENAKEDNAILFLPDIQSFVGSGACSARPEGDVLSLLQPYMQQGSLQVIATVTPEGWMDVSRHRPAVARLFNPIQVPELSANEARSALEHRARDWQRTFSLKIMPDAVDEIMELSDRLFPSRRYPGKACNLMEMALALLRRSAPGPTPLVTRMQISEAVHLATGLPDFLLNPAKPVRRRTLFEFFESRVFGQQEPIAALVRRIQMVKARMCAPGRPLGTYIFAGPTGVGKTLLARTLAELLLGTEKRLLRFDMSEYSCIDSVSRFIGQPDAMRPGAGLIDAALTEPFPVILLDEIEKAHRKVFDSLLQVLGEGRLSDGAGRTACFSNAFIVMTTNLGCDMTRVEFAGAAGDDGGWTDRVHQALRQNFRPEFLNRVTDVFTFRPLTRAQVEQVARAEVDRIRRREGVQALDASVHVSDGLFRQMLAQGWSPHFGVRPMERAADCLVGVPVARWLSEHPHKPGARLELEWDAPAGCVSVRASGS